MTGVYLRPPLETLLLEWALHHQWFPKLSWKKQNFDGWCAMPPIAGSGSLLLDIRSWTTSGIPVTYRTIHTAAIHWDVTVQLLRLLIQLFQQNNWTKNWPAGLWAFSGWIVAAICIDCTAAALYSLINTLYIDWLCDKTCLACYIQYTLQAAKRCGSLFKKNSGGVAHVTYNMLLAQIVGRPWLPLPPPRLPVALSIQFMCTYR